MPVETVVAAVRGMTAVPVATPVDLASACLNTVTRPDRNPSAPDRLRRRQRRWPAAATLACTPRRPSGQADALAVPEHPEVPDLVAVDHQEVGMPGSTAPRRALADPIAAGALLAFVVAPPLGDLYNPECLVDAGEVVVTKWIESAAARVSSFLEKALAWQPLLPSVRRGARARLRSRSVRLAPRLHAETPGREDPHGFTSLSKKEASMVRACVRSIIPCLSRSLPWVGALLAAVSVWGSPAEARITRIEITRVAVLRALPGRSRRRAGCRDAPTGLWSRRCPGPG